MMTFLLGDHTITPKEHPQIVPTPDFSNRMFFHDFNPVSSCDIVCALQQIEINKFQKPHNAFI